MRAEARPTVGKVVSQSLLRPDHAGCLFPIQMSLVRKRFTKTLIPGETVNTSIQLLADPPLVENLSGQTRAAIPEEDLVVS